MAETCVSCRKSTAESLCGVCGESVCRKCRQFLGEDEFPWAPERPPALRHTYYCDGCFAEHVEPFRDDYEATCELARNINIFFKHSKSLFKVRRRATHGVEIQGGVDRDETILRMAFQAARLGFNALTEVEVESAKIRHAGWQKSTWTGRGWPAEVHSHEMDK